MKICTFSNIIKTINANISNAYKLNQTELFVKLFHHFSDNYPDFDFDNGNICRWINGTRAASCQFSAFYSNKVNKQHLSVDIEENVFPFLTDIYAVIDKIYSLVVDDTTISCRKKIQLTKNYPCDDICTAADFLAECIAFSLERKSANTLQESRQNDISEAYNQLIFAIDNFKNYADKIMSL